MILECQACRGRWDTDELRVKVTPYRTVGECPNCGGTVFLGVIIDEIRGKVAHMETPTNVVNPFESKAGECPHKNVVSYGVGGPKWEQCEDCGKVVSEEERKTGRVVDAGLLKAAGNALRILKLIPSSTSRHIEAELNGAIVVLEEKLLATHTGKVMKEESVDKVKVLCPECGCRGLTISCDGCDWTNKKVPTAHTTKAGKGDG